MKQRPILFTDPLPAAIRSGVKTETRRTKGLESINTAPGEWKYVCPNSDGDHVFRAANGDTRVVKCPYGVPGEFLYVRQRWRPLKWDANTGELSVQFSDGQKSQFKEAFPEDYTGRRFLNLWLSICEELHKKNVKPNSEGAYCIPEDKNPFSWRPSIHLPKSASSLLLEITDVKPERLKDITRQAAINEGVNFLNCPTVQTVADISHNLNPGTFSAVQTIDYVAGFLLLWEEINGAGSVSQNPFVWAIKFRLV